MASDLSNCRICDFRWRINRYHHQKQTKKPQQKNKEERGKKQQKKSHLFSLSWLLGSPNLQNQGPPLFDLQNLFKPTCESFQNLQNQEPLSLLHLHLHLLIPYLLLLNPYLLLLTLHPPAFLPFVGFNLVQIEGKKLEGSNSMGFYSSTFYIFSQNGGIKEKNKKKYYFIVVCLGC